MARPVMVTALAYPRQHCTTQGSIALFNAAGECWWGHTQPCSHPAMVTV